MTKAIIFDFDGVIHDTFEIVYKINKEIMQRNLTIEEYKDWHNGNIYKTKKVTAKHSQTYFKLQDERFKGLKIKEKIRKELFYLEKKYLLFIISSNKESALNDYFENNGILHIFKEVLGYETHKSKQTKFNMILKKYGLKRNDCIFVTDTLGDILEANKVRIKTIAVDYGFHDRKRLERGNPYSIISDFREIKKIIE